MDSNYVFFSGHFTCGCTLSKKMRHFCDIGLHPLLDYNDLTLKFLLETRLQSKSFDTLDDLLGFQVQKL